MIDTHEGEGDGEKPKKKKKKKAHKGYAFVVFEREKDMKGIASLILNFAEHALRIHSHH